MSEINIRRAKDDDIPTLDNLLFQVHEVHHKARPDLFKADAKKYTDEQLKEILANDKTPVFVAESDGKILCVDENERGKHIGKTLYDFVVSYAKKSGYYNVTLNVWADNKKAVGFYEKIGLRVQKIGMEKIL